MCADDGVEEDLEENDEEEDDVDEVDEEDGETDDDANVFRECLDALDPD